MHLYFTGIFPIFFDDSIAIKGKNQRENKGTRRFLMKRKLVMLATAMMILVLAAPAWAESVTLNFTSLFGGYAGGSYDQLNFNGLTITSRTTVGVGITNVPDPWGPNPPARNGVPGDVYWGNLGDLGVAGRSFFGLGVLTDMQTPVNSTTGPITYSETLRFHFDTPQVGQGAGMQLHFTALGLDAIPSGNNTSPADNMRVYIKVASGEINFADINANAISIFGTDYGSVINWMLTQTNINYADERVTDFAIEQIWGSASNPNRQFGIGSVTYNAVPEPLTLLLLGAGLIGLAGIRRFGK
jgi:hypothetical protein